jgi:putative ABC transport system permease protein
MGVLTRAYRNISRRKSRVLLVVIALSFSVALMVSIPTGIAANQAATQNLSENYYGVIDSMEEEIQETMTQLDVGLLPGKLGGNMEFINESAIEDILSIQNVKDVVPFLEQAEGTIQTFVKGGGSYSILIPDYMIVGFTLDSSLLDNYPIGPSNITKGRNLIEGDSEVVILSLNNSALFGAGVGDQVMIRETDFSVIGIHGSTIIQDYKNLYMSLSDAQEITGLTGNISRMQVYAEDEAYVDDIASELTSQYPEFSITTNKERLSQLEKIQEQNQDTLENIDATLAQMDSLATQEIGVVVFATGFIVFVTMMYTVRERTKEIGVLKAIGFSNWNIMNQFMAEGIVLSIIAGVLGTIMGIFGAPILSSFLLPEVNPLAVSSVLEGGKNIPKASSGFFSGSVSLETLGIQGVAVVPDLQTLLFAFGVALLLGAVGSLYPAWRASRTTPLEALRYE